MLNLIHSRSRAISTAVLILTIFTVGCGKPSASEPQKPSAPTPEKLGDFDAARAQEHMKRLTEIGPRPPGSPAIKKTQEYIVSELKSYGLKVTEDDFTAQTPKSKVAMKNIVGELAGERSDVVMVAGHYDTKPQPGFIGANDGASSTAAVLEMARALVKAKPEYTLWFVFFDGEEAFVAWDEMDGRDNTYGSRHMAEKLSAAGAIKRIKAMVLVDMVGDKDLDLLRDSESTRWLVDIIWNTAHQIGHKKHFLQAEGAYGDDHIPFKDAGVPVIDIIDFNYGPNNSYWHTNQDTLDKVSGESVKIVGDVVIRSLPEIFRRLNEQKN